MEEAHSSKWALVSLVYMAMWLQYCYKNLKPSILNCIQPFVCRNYLVKFELMDHSSYSFDLALGFFLFPHRKIHCVVKNFESWRSGKSIQNLCFGVTSIWVEKCFENSFNHAFKRELQTSWFVNSKNVFNFMGNISQSNKIISNHKYCFLSMLAPKYK